MSAFSATSHFQSLLQYFITHCRRNRVAATCGRHFRSKRTSPHRYPSINTRDTNQKMKYDFRNAIRHELSEIRKNIFTVDTTTSLRWSHLAAHLDSSHHASSFCLTDVGLTASCLHFMLLRLLTSRASVLPSI